jgi:phosphoribosyl 1,2-cyclic phosphodiesterase
MQLTFWGTRGSIAVPGPHTLRHGGNTTCLELWLDGGELVVLDCGTGVRALGEKLARLERIPPVHLLITHLHWDHVNGFPFFDPIYSENNLIRVGGWPSGYERIIDLFDPGRSDGRFPLRFDQIPANIIKDPALAPPRFQIGETRIRTQPLSHPQGSIAYRFQGKNGDLVFMTDNELDPKGNPSPDELAAFCQGAKVLVHDGQYLPEEMEHRRGWGHSDWRSALELARMAGVERLVITHHDPSRRDSQVEEIVSQANYAAAGGMRVVAAYEGMTLQI